MHIEKISLETRPILRWKIATCLEEVAFCFPLQLVMDLYERSCVLVHQAGSKHDAEGAGVDMLSMEREEVCM